MNPILQKRFEEIESLLKERKQLNGNLTRNIGLSTGLGAAGVLALIAITGGGALAALPAAYGAMQVGKAATKGAIAGARYHQQKQSTLDDRICDAVKSLIDDIGRQLATGGISTQEAAGAYYRLKYMDDSFAEDIKELAGKLNLDN